MSGVEASDVLRIAVISGLIGFGVFCASYSLAVWFRRNRARPNLRARIAFLILILGIFGAAGNWAYNEYSSRSGIVGGQDLFVVRARRNVTTDKLATEGRVEQGDRLVEFLPPSIDEQLAVIDSHIKQSQAKVDYFKLRALPVDTMLIQRQAQIRQQIDQATTMALDIQKSRREAERAYLDARTQYAERLSLNDLQVSAEKQALGTAVLQIEIAQTSMNRAVDLRNRGGIGTLAAVEEKTTNYLTHSLARNRAQANLTSLERYRAAMDESYGRTLGALGAQLAKLDIDVATNREAMERLTKEFGSIEKAVAEDRLRAVDATEQEREAAVHELNALKAERVSMLAVTQVRAPFSGEVVYRHPSPGFAPENTPVLALSAGSGFVARIWLPTGEVEAIKKAGKVQFALEQPILNRFFVGEFRLFEVAPYEKNRVIASFDVKLPLEAITLLASAGNPVQVKLLWRPSLLENYAFRGSIVLTLLGCVGVVASGKRRKLEDEMSSPQIESGEVLEARLQETARHFHTLLRQGRLDNDPDLVRSVIRLVERMGDPALKMFREEIVFDEELEQALFKWSRHNYDPALMNMLNRVRGLAAISHAA